MASNTTSLGDTCEDWVTLRNGLTSATDDAAGLTDYLGTAIPSHAVLVAGHQRYKIAVVGTDAEDETLTIYIGLWPRASEQKGFLAAEFAVALGAATTTAHPVTGATGTTYYEADTFTIAAEGATVPYETYICTDGYGSNVIIDVTGEAYVSVHCTLGTAASATIIGKAL